MQFDLVKSRGQLVAEKRRKSERAKLRRKKDEKKKKKGKQLVDADSLLEGKRTGRSRGSDITLVFTCVQNSAFMSSVGCVNLRPATRGSQWAGLPTISDPPYR